MRYADTETDFILKVPFELGTILLKGKNCHTYCTCAAGSVGQVNLNLLSPSIKQHV